MLKVVLFLCTISSIAPLWRRAIGIELIIDDDMVQNVQSANATATRFSGMDHVDLTCKVVFLCRDTEIFQTCWIICCDTARVGHVNDVRLMQWIGWRDKAGDATTIISPTARILLFHHFKRDITVNTSERSHMHTFIMQITTELHTFLSLKFKRGTPVLLAAS